MVINNFLHNFYSLYTPAAVPSLLSPQSCPYKPLPSLLIFLLRDPTGLSTASPTEAQATESETALLQLLGDPIPQGHITKGLNDSWPLKRPASTVLANVPWGNKKEGHETLSPKSHNLLPVLLL